MGVTNIQWTSGINGAPGYTFNPWLGCRKVAPECQNCYITSTPPFRFRGLAHGSQRVRTAESTWKQPRAWNRKAEGGAERPRVFCLSLGDWLDDENVPIEWLADLLRVIHYTPNLDWLLLTKRPQNWRPRMYAVMHNFMSVREMTSKWLANIPPANVWIGVSAGADQAAALAIPSRVHFLSCEPMLKPLNFEHARKFSWIIFGGESGNKARPCNIAWIDEGLGLCRTYKIPAFVKQLGAKPYYEPVPAHRVESRWPVVCDAEHPLKLRDSHGGDMAEWPEDLRMRQFPEAAYVQPQPVLI